jgi:ABC-type glycerol-3-phosphate transport system substrate-binding protein
VSETTRNLPRSYAGTTLKITWGNTPAYAQVVDFSKQFSDATGIQLEFVTLLQADRYQKMMLDASSGTNSFDLYLTAYQWKEQLAPYAADLTHIDKEVKGVPDPEWTDYPQSALDAYAKFDDKIVAIPFLGDASMLVWNKKELREAGLDPNTAPQSWDQVYQNGRKLTAGQQYGFNMPAGKSIQTACIWITLFHGFGGQYFAADGKAGFASEPSVRALHFMADELGKVSPAGRLTWDFPEMINSLATGQAAQGYMWAGGFSTLFDPTKSVMAHELGFAPTPQAVLLGGWGIAVNAKSRHLDAAKLFVGWLTSPEISKLAALVAGQPCRTSSFRAPEVVARFPALPAVLEAMSGKVATYIPIKESEQINIMIYDEANAACAGTKTPEQAAGDLQEKAVAFLKRRGYQRG